VIRSKRKKRVLWKNEQVPGRSPDAASAGGAAAHRGGGPSHECVRVSRGDHEVLPAERERGRPHEGLHQAERQPVPREGRLFDLVDQQTYCTFGPVCNRNKAVKLCLFLRIRR